MNRNMLLAFVEDMGHEYEKLLEGAMVQTEEEKGERPVRPSFTSKSLGKGPEGFSYPLEKSVEEREE